MSNVLIKFLESCSNVSITEDLLNQLRLTTVNLLNTSVMQNETIVQQTQTINEQTQTINELNKTIDEQTTIIKKNPKKE